MNKKTHLVSLTTFFIAMFFIGFTAEAQSIGRMISTYNRAKDAGNSVRGKSYKSYDMGFGVGFTSFDYNYTHAILNDNLEKIGEEGEDGSFTAFSWRMGATTDFWLTEIGYNASLTLRFGAKGNIYSYYPKSWIDSENNNRFENPMMGYRISLPLGLNINTGGMSSLNKNDKTSFTAGVGIQPSYYVLVYGDHTAMNVDLKPYVSFTAGFFAGIQWNVFMNFTPGSKTVIQSREEGKDGSIFKGRRIAGGNSQVSYATLKQKATIELGISFLPFSFLWEDTYR